VACAIVAVDWPLRRPLRNAPTVLKNVEVSAVSLLAYEMAVARFLDFRWGASIPGEFLSSVIPCVLAPFISAAESTRV
jgi:hypothetical protein